MLRLAYHSVNSFKWISHWALIDIHIPSLRIHLQVLHVCDEHYLHTCNFFDVRRKRNDLK